jgi:hypothetical protein
VRFLRSGRRGIRGARRKMRAVAQPQWKVAEVCPDTWGAGIGRGSRLLPPQRKGGPFVACRLAALLLLSGPLAYRLAAWSRFLPTYVLPTSHPPPMIGTYSPPPPQLWHRSSVTKTHCHPPIRSFHSAFSPNILCSV